MGKESSRTTRRRSYLGRSFDLIVEEAKQPQQYTWVIIHEVPTENWMVDRLTLPELRKKLQAEKKPE